MTSGNIDPKAAMESGQRIDAIKQLIFGENMVEYDERFSEVVDKLKSTQKALENRITDLEKAMTKTIDMLRKEHTSRMDTTDKKNDTSFAKMNDSKADRKNLGKMLEKIGQSLQG